MFFYCNVSAKRTATAYHRLQYQLHRAGKTTEAKADLARLALIRKEREEAAARKAAEKADQDEAKAKALAASGRKR